MDDWSAVVDATAELLRNLDELAAEAAEALRRDIPEYALVPRASLIPLMRGNLATSLHAVSQRRTFDDDDVARIVAVVPQRAAQGVPLDPLMSAVSLVERVAFERLSPLLAKVQPSTLQEVWSIRMANAETLLRAVAASHRTVELEQTAEVQARLAVALQALLGGEIAEAEGASTLARLAMDPLGHHYVWCVRPAGDVTGFLNALLGGPQRAPKGVFTLWEQDLVGLSTTPPDDVRDLADGGVEGPVPVTGLHRAFQRASHTAATARAFGLSGIHAREELGLLSTVTADLDAGEILRARFLEPLAAAGVLAEDLLRTVQVFLESGRRREVVAKELSLHPNTVTYRLSRFVHFTGADLDDHRTQAELWWLFRHLEAHR